MTRTERRFTIRYRVLNTKDYLILCGQSRIRDISTTDKKHFFVRCTCHKEWPYELSDM
jgi:hypothetical protein